MDSCEVVHRGLPIDRASKALILLHGRGSNAQDILSLADAFSVDQFYIVAPQAPDNSWYPHSFMADEASNEPSLTMSIAYIKNIIDDIAKHIQKDKIYLIGFSQGACLALEVATRYVTKYGGIVAFTGGLIGKIINENKYHGNFEGTKVFIGNSDHDVHVPLTRSIQSKKLIENGADVTLKIYPGMAHTINEDEIDWVEKNMISKN